MAKELPYFRFTSAEWLQGDISLEATYMKGVYIDICAYYWFRDCSLTLEMLKKKYSSDIDAIINLINLGILKSNEDSDVISINFLDEQWVLLGKSHKKRVLAGKKGAKIRYSNAKAKPKPSHSYKDNNKDKEKDNNKDNLEFKKFWNLYDKKIGDKTKLSKKWDNLTKEEKELIFLYIPKYKKSQPDKQYRKNPDTFLNNKSWNDEIIKKEEPAQKYDRPVKQVKQDEFKLKKEKEDHQNKFNISEKLDELPEDSFIRRTLTKPKTQRTGKTKRIGEM